MVELRKAFEGEFPLVLKNITTGKSTARVNKINSDVEDLISNLLRTDPIQRLDADKVVSHPCVLKTCIDISLDLGRVENKDIESLVNESIFCSENTIRLPRSLPATLTIAQESTISPTQQTVK